MPRADEMTAVGLLATPARRPATRDRFTRFLANCPTRAARVAGAVSASVLLWPGIHQACQAIYRWRFLNSGRGQHWGHFTSAAAAMAFLPRHLRTGYDNTELTTINLRSFMKIHSFDWPVIFYIERLLGRNKLRSVTDYGGHVGVKYYAFRDVLRLPPDLAWQVIDVPAMVDEGVRRARTMNGTHLRFSATIDDFPECDLLICSGVLQYSPVKLADLICTMRSRPPAVIVSKVPFVETEGFHTLENFGTWKMPYQVFNRARHESDLERLGYRLAMRWAIKERDFRVPFSKDNSDVRMFGELWTQIDDTDSAYPNKVESYDQQIA